MPATAPVYDLMLLLSTSAEEARRGQILSEVQSTISSSGGSVERNDDWGTRGMTYRIAHESDAEYHLLQFSGPPTLLESLSHNLRIADGVLRFRIIKVTPGTPPAPESAPPVVAAVAAVAASRSGGAAGASSAEASAEPAEEAASAGGADDAGETGGIGEAGGAGEQPAEQAPAEVATEPAGAGDADVAASTQAPAESSADETPAEDAAE